jgi:hypothetical protein
MSASDVPLDGLTAAMSMTLPAAEPPICHSLSLRRQAQHNAAIAAAFLEHLCVWLQDLGFAFTRATAGKGSYAWCTCSHSDLKLTLVLGLLERISDSSYTFELQVSASKTGQRTGKSKASSVEPSDADLVTWKRFRTAVAEAATLGLRATQATWTIPGHHASVE